jgi:hypothetical protein
MAAIPIKTEKALAIITDWRIGNTTQRKLAEKHSVSLGTVSKLCKGVEQDGPAIVNIGTQYRQELAGQDVTMVNAIEREVDERTKHIQFFTNATVSNISKMLKNHIEPVKANPSIAEHKMAQDAIAKGSETVLGKLPDSTPPATTVNILTMSNSDLERIARGR